MNQDYIPSPEYFKTYWTYKKYPDIFQPIDKVAIKRIKIDKKRLDVANEIRDEIVMDIINNFHIKGWEPIFIHKDCYLIDGQHRLSAAKKMKLKFIDAVIIDEEKLKRK